ncbi:MAG: MucR family transcriptional regulator, partial [Desulfovibrio sp.]|nr:MucR family transcriptional regulator [Desulfovibrio sp.]
KEKWKLKPGTALVCKSLQRERKKKMLDMKLWERRTDRKARNVKSRRVRIKDNAAPAAENA